VSCVPLRRRCWSDLSANTVTVSLYTVTFYLLDVLMCRRTHASAHTHVRSHVRTSARTHVRVQTPGLRQPQSRPGPTFGEQQVCARAARVWLCACVTAPWHYRSRLMELVHARTEVEKTASRQPAPQSMSVWGA